MRKVPEIAQASRGRGTHGPKDAIHLAPVSSSGLVMTFICGFARPKCNPEALRARTEPNSLLFRFERTHITHFCPNLLRTFPPFYLLKGLRHEIWRERRRPRGKKGSKPPSFPLSRSRKPTQTGGREELVICNPRAREMLAGGSETQRTK